MCHAVAHATTTRMLCSAVCYAQQACTYYIHLQWSWTIHGACIYSEMDDTRIHGSRDLHSGSHLHLMVWMHHAMPSYNHALHSTTCSPLYAAIALLHTSRSTCTSIPSWSTPILGSSMPVPIPCTTPDPCILDAWSWCVHSTAACMQYTMALPVAPMGPHALHMRTAAARTSSLLLSWYPGS